MFQPAGERNSVGLVRKELLSQCFRDQMFLPNYACPTEDLKNPSVEVELSVLV
jgi:hypothetical protein